MNKILIRELMSKSFEMGKNDLWESDFKEWLEEVLVR